MGVSKRGRRSIEVDGSSFVWWVAPDLERGGLLALSVISDDKRFNVRGQLAQDHGRDLQHDDIGRSDPNARPLLGKLDELLPLDAEGGLAVLECFDVVRMKRRNRDDRVVERDGLSWQQRAAQNASCGRRGLSVEEDGLLIDESPESALGIDKMCFDPGWLSVTVGVACDGDAEAKHRRSLAVASPRGSGMGSCRIATRR